MIFLRAAGRIISAVAWKLGFILYRRPPADRPAMRIEFDGETYGGVAEEAVPDPVERRRLIVDMLQLGSRYFRDRLDERERSAL